jgi:hypothetical protein
MTDPPRYDDERSRVPRWAKIAGLVVIVVVLAVVAVMLISGGGHTPRPHGAGPVPAYVTVGV